MADEGDVQIEQQSNAGKWILILLAVVVVAVFGYAQYLTHQRIAKLTEDLSGSQAQVKELQNRMQTAEAQEETLARQAGMTKKELAQRAAALQAAQLAAVSRLENEQKAQINTVSGEISGVKSDVGGVRTDVAATKADLDATKAKLQSTIGDLGMQSGLIAHTQGDLEVLKHKGDRNYYEFTLDKGAGAKNVGTIKIDLKKIDLKRSKFTLVVSSDDRNIEKKDRTLDEPIQFYSGKTPALFEIVVNNIGKKTVSGYLSTPKNAPQQISMP